MALRTAQAGSGELEDQEELLAGAYGNDGPIVPFWVAQTNNWRRARLFITIYGWILALFIVTLLAVAHVPIIIDQDNGWQTCQKGPWCWCTLAYHVYAGTYPGMSSVSTPSACVPRHVICLDTLCLRGEGDEGQLELSPFDGDRWRPWPALALSCLCFGMETS